MYYIFRLGHGWFGGGIERERDIVPTIDACIHFQHILLLEVDKDETDMCESTKSRGGEVLEY